MAAEADIHAWELERAEQRLRTVLERAPNFLRAIMLLAKFLVLQARLKEASRLSTGWFAASPTTRPRCNISPSFTPRPMITSRRSTVYAKVLALDQADLAMWIVYAQQLRMLGRKEESIAAFRRALALDPNSGPAWWGLVNYFTAEITAADSAALEQALAAREGTAEDGGPLHVAAGILAEGRGDFAEAFRHIAEGKQLRLLAYPYDLRRGERSGRRADPRLQHGAVRRARPGRVRRFVADLHHRHAALGHHPARADPRLPFPDRAGRRAADHAAPARAPPARRRFRLCRTHRDPERATP